MREVAAAISGELDFQQFWRVQKMEQCLEVCGRLDTSERGKEPDSSLRKSLTDAIYLRKIAKSSGLTLKKAYTYLGNVTEHKQCIPFRRFAGAVGRTAQAKEFKTTKGELDSIFWRIMDSGWGRRGISVEQIE